MSQVVNLRQARKQKWREAKARKATERRAHFGQKKAEKSRQAKEREREDIRLEGHRLPKPPAEPTSKDES